MKRYNYCLAMAVFMSGLLMSGCASFADWKLQKLETLPASEKADLKAKLKLTWNQYFNGNQRTEFEEKGREVGEKVALKTFRNSGHFSVIDTEISDPDLDIKIKFKNQEEGSALLAFISGFTFCVIPASASNLFVMDAEVTHLKTGETRTYHLEDSVNTYIQILLIFIMPFNWPGTVGEDVLDNMYNHLIAEMQKDGLLRQAQTRGTGIEMVSLSFSE